MGIDTRKKVVFDRDRWREVVLAIKAIKESEEE